MNLVKHDSPVGRLDKLSWEILNATADDCESLEQIYRSICFEPIEPSGGYREVSDAPMLHEVADRMWDLAAQGLLVPVMDEEGNPTDTVNDPRLIWRGWFRMSETGKILWQAWEEDA